MRKLLYASLIGFFMACQNNPYDGMGDVHDPKVPPVEKPVPQPIFQINLTDTMTVDEGTEIVQKFSIQDSVHPQGLFGVYLRNFPDGTTLKQISATDFEIHFLPDASFVKGQAARIVQAQIHVENADLHVVDQSVTWNVKNKGLAPVVQAVANLSATVGTTLSFSLRAVDVNGEAFPHFRLVSSGSATSVTSGEATLPSDPQFALPATEFRIQWAGIAADQAGKTVTFTVQACESTYQKCTNYDVQVNVIAAGP